MVYEKLGFYQILAIYRIVDSFDDYGCNGRVKYHPFFVINLDYVLFGKV